jgi:hypothetical protein
MRSAGVAKSAALHENRGLRPWLTDMAYTQAVRQHDRALAEKASKPARNAVRRGVD